MIDLPKFPFVYVGGGHFRDSRVPKGQSAPMLHGNEVLVEYEKFVKEHLQSPIPEPNFDRECYGNCKELKAGTDFFVFPDEIC